MELESREKDALIEEYENMLDEVAQASQEKEEKVEELEKQVRRLEEDLMKFRFKKEETEEKFQVNASVKARKQRRNSQFLKLKMKSTNAKEEPKMSGSRIWRTRRDF